MSALYENLIEVQGIDGTEDRGQVARLKESLTLTVEVAAALDATSDSDPATTGAPSEIAETCLPSSIRPCRRSSPPRLKGNGHRRPFDPLR